MDVTARNPVKSTQTAFRIVEVLVEENGASVSELADATSFTKGTVHNHLSTLRELGYVIKKANSYHVGLGFLFPAGRARDRAPMTDISMAPVVELAETTGERVDLVVQEDHRIVILHSEYGDKYTGPDSLIGASLPLHCSAPGKAVLAHLDIVSAADAIEIATPVERTDQTVTDPQQLEDELDYIREEGLAYDRGELYEGMQGVAAPLFLSGTVRGAIAVIGSDDHMRGKTLQQDIPGLVISSAERLKREIRDF